MSQATRPSPDGALWYPEGWVALTGQTSSLHITGQSTLYTPEILFNGESATVTVDNQGQVNLLLFNLQKGTAVVSGTGSKLTVLNQQSNASKAYIGKGQNNSTGAGTLIVKEGATFISYSGVDLTSNKEFSATLLIDRGSHVALYKGLSPQVGGAVDMKILNGGSLISKSSATFGKPNGDDGKPTTLLVDGDGSR